ncbi:extracellular matrix protein 1 [Xiphias gladius]|uniref:extracellular matrix protein 1 n=1 Tax=Xiphias gladius TaxID=8245 RepID=UPI001A99C376|nr:extracellular matrix protein 1 [Xiphias gladius]XP_039976858.1 extracellular matrix protein 1 [Xiphias gladius]
MTSIGGFTGLWIVALLTLHGANLGETQRYSLNEPDVPFPPARPTAQNLAAICHQGQGRPRYLASFFPASGASHFRRRGNAINRLESWYSLCCSGQVAQQSHQILCCAQQAWKQALSQFCDEEYATMTVSYECCKHNGDARWTCFDSELPNPNYNPTPGYTAPQIPMEPGFTFSPNSC